MKPRRCLAGGKQPRDGRLRRFPVNSNAAHHVMAGWSNLHWSLGYVHICEFTKLVIHARELALHVLRRLVRDIEVSASMLGASALTDLCIDRSRYYITR